MKCNICQGTIEVFDTFTRCRKCFSHFDKIDIVSPFQQFQADLNKEIKTLPRSERKYRLNADKVKLLTCDDVNGKTIKRKYKV